MIPVSKFCVLLVFFILFEEISKVICVPQLILKNDGPAVLGANVTFSALLLGYSAQRQLTYIFNDGVQKEIQILSTSFNVSVRRLFPPDQYVEGRYCMNVTVNADFIIYHEVLAKNFTCFTLERFLIGKISLHQGNRSINNDVDEVPIGIRENFTAVIDLYDPNNFLKDAVVVYSWSFDMDNYITFNNSFTYKFTDVGYKQIIVKATATFPNSQSISGFFSKVINAEEPVINVNYSGNPFLYHGDFLKLNISCDGTPLFEYCFEILKENTTTINNFTCSQVSMFTSCHMVINKFLPDGKYQLVIYIANDVSAVKKIIEIMVYNVSIKPALSTIIIPIICSLLTLIIIAVGISYYIMQRNQLAVEVADFDFQDESDSYTGERTFFEKIFDSFACKNCGQNRWSCVNNRSESDPLLNDVSLPYV